MFLFFLEFRRSELIVTNNDDEDIAIAAISGTTYPAMANGSAKIL